MKFLAILIAIFFYQHWSGGNPMRKLIPFKAYHSWFESRNLPLKLRFALCVGLPSLLVAYISIQFGNGFLGLLGLLISLSVLIYAIEIFDDEVDFNEQVIWLRSVDDKEQLSDVVQRQEDFELIHIYDLFQSIVPILFWFIFAGPAGSLLYVLSLWYFNALDKDDVEAGFVGAVVYWLEWPAALITVLIFALVGNFGRSIDYWITSISDMKASSANRLLKMAAVAIDVPEETYGDDVIGFAKLAEYRVNELRMLCRRALYGWLGFAAIATIIGW